MRAPENKLPDDDQPKTPSFEVESRTKEFEDITSDMKYLISSLIGLVQDRTLGVKKRPEEDEKTYQDSLDSFQKLERRFNSLTGPSQSADKSSAENVEPLSAIKDYRSARDQVKMWLAMCKDILHPATPPTKTERPQRPSRAA